MAIIHNRCCEASQSLDYLRTVHCCLCRRIAAYSTVRLLLSLTLETLGLHNYALKGRHGLQPSTILDCVLVHVASATARRNSHRSSVDPLYCCVVADM